MFLRTTCCTPFPSKTLLWAVLLMADPYHESLKPRNAKSPNYRCRPVSVLSPSTHCQAPIEVLPCANIRQDAGRCSFQRTLLRELLQSQGPRNRTRGESRDSTEVQDTPHQCHKPSRNWEVQLEGLDTGCGAGCWEDVSRRRKMVTRLVRGMRWGHLEAILMVADGSWQSIPV